MIITNALILNGGLLQKEILHTLLGPEQLKTKTTPNGYHIELNVIKILQWVKRRYHDAYVGNKGEYRGNKTKHKRMRYPNNK
jgi:hypothetical protein